MSSVKGWSDRSRLATFSSWQWSTMKCGERWGEPFALWSSALQAELVTDTAGVSSLRPCRMAHCWVSKQWLNLSWSWLEGDWQRAERSWRVAGVGPEPGIRRQF